MKYTHSSKHRKNCPHDSETRVQLGSRLRYARLKLGWSIEDAGKYFQVTDRTLHNWENGSHRIPFAVYKLARILARLELPGEAWAGWRLEGSVLITPEGRQIAPQDGTWWSLLVRQAAGFRSTYAEANRLRLLLDEITGRIAGPVRQAQRAGTGEAGGLVPYKTTLDSSLDSLVDRRQNDVIMTSWPILYDFQTPLTHLHAPRPITLASALTPLYASPWTPTCAVQLTLQRPPVSPHRLSKSHLKQLLPDQCQPNPASSPERKSKRSTRPKGASDRSSSGKNEQVSARAAAANAAEQPSTPRGAP